MRPIHGPRAYIWTSILRWYFDDSGPMYLLCDIFYTVPLDLYRSMFIYGISILFHIFLQDVRHIPVIFICRIFWMCVEPCLATTFQVHLRSGVGKASVWITSRRFSTIFFITGRRARWYILSYAFGNDILSYVDFYFYDRFRMQYILLLILISFRILGGFGPFHFV